MKAAAIEAQLHELRGRYVRVPLGGRRAWGYIEGNLVRTIRICETSTTLGAWCVRVAAGEGCGAIYFDAGDVRTIRICPDGTANTLIALRGCCRMPATAPTTA